MKKLFTRRPIFCLACVLLTLLSVAIPPRAGADSFVEFEGFRYRLNVVPDAPDEQCPVSATLVEAVSYEDAIMGVKLPDFVYADGVQYPVTGIESTAYTGYYGIKSVGYNKFCGPLPIYQSSEGSYLSEVYVGDTFYGAPGVFDGWTALKTLTVDYASQYRPINLYIGTYNSDCLENISLSAFTDNYDFVLWGTGIRRGPELPHCGPILASICNVQVLGGRTMAITTPLLS